MKMYRPVGSPEISKKKKKIRICRISNYCLYLSYHKKPSNTITFEIIRYVLISTFNPDQMNRSLRIFIAGFLALNLILIP